jgi:serine protease AprX
MMSSIGIVERMRWMSALAVSAVLALTASIALGVADGQLHFSSGASSTLGASPAPAGSTSPLDPRIGSLAAAHPGRSIETIVQFDTGIGATTANADTTGVGGRVIGELPIINGLAAKMTASQARTLATNPNVHSVSLNTQITPQGGPGQSGAHNGPDQGDSGGRGGSNGNSQLQTTYDQTLRATGLWDAGGTGAGVGVAVVDTGVDGQLPDFRNSHGRSRVVATAVTNPDATNALDGYGHGTDVAGIIAGNGNNLPSRDPMRGQYVGVAPDANLISIKVSDETGNATVLNVIYGLQFAVDHKAQYNIRVVNLSLDSTTPQSYTTDPLDAAAEAVWMHGIVVVAAAGNRGTDPDAVQYSPANDPYVITVGAVDENGTPTTSDDAIADWSSRGTTQDGLQKPDVYAPGAHIVSVLAPGSVFAGECSTCIVGGRYILASGTSLSSPMIAGLVADTLQLHPSWTPDQVKGALTSQRASSSSTLAEVSGVRLARLVSPPLADLGLTPNQLVGPDGTIDYSLSRWSLSRWSTAPATLSAGFARSSYVCSCLTSGPGSIDPSLSRWSMSSWSMLPVTVTSK